MAVILIVDDSPVDRHRVASLLQKQPGWSVVNAANSEEALASIQLQLPDVLLTDLRMPGADGLQLVQDVKRMYPALPVILMTAFGSEDIAVLALDSGAASYLPKRNMGRHLHRTIKNILQLVQSNRRHQRVLNALMFSQTCYRLENDLSLISDVVGHFRDNLIALKLCEENEAMRVAIALSEAITNAIWHGNLEIQQTSSDEELADLVVQKNAQHPYRDRRVVLTATESAREAVYVVCDEGSGFDRSRLPDPRDRANLEKFSEHRGMRLIYTFMDEVRHNSSGNEITMIKRRREKATKPS